MNTANNIRSAIGHAVEMAAKGWKRSGGGRGMWKREVKRLIRESHDCQTRLETFSDGSTLETQPRGERTAFGMMAHDDYLEQLRREMLDSVLRVQAMDKERPSQAMRPEAKNAD